MAKSGDKFEEGIKKKNDPRFDFLNPWSVYNRYYLQEKKRHVKEIKEQALAEAREEERRKNLKVSFGLGKKPAQPTNQPSTSSSSSLLGVANNKTKATVTKANVLKKVKPTKPAPAVSHVFGKDAESEEEEETESADGFVPRKDPSVTKMKADLQKKIQEKEALLNRLKEQALQEQQKTKFLQAQQVRIVPKTASAEEAFNNLTPEEREKLKQKLLQGSLGKTGTEPDEKQLMDERKKRASNFAAMLKKSQTDASSGQQGSSSLASESEDAEQLRHLQKQQQQQMKQKILQQQKKETLGLTQAEIMLRKRKQQAAESAAKKQKQKIDKDPKQAAFFGAIDQAFGGGT